MSLGNLRLGLHNQADGFAHRSSAAGWHQHCCQETLVEGFNIHIRLVGFDHKHRLTTTDLVTRLFEPFDDLPLRHRGAEGGHEDVVGRQNRLRRG